MILVLLYIIQEIEPNEKIQINIIQNCQMGCTTAQKQQVGLPVAMSTTSGVLKITITNAVIFHQAGVFKMDPYIIFKLSNQQFTSKVAIKGSKRPNFFQTFTFYINSCFKEYGRNLQMTMFDKKKLGADNLIGYGIVDLNPIINMKKKKDEFRCMLNYEYKQAGFINVVAQFIQEATQILHFRFQQATIRRNTSTFGNMNCWVQVIIGEQIMQTSKKMDTKQKPPSWLTQALTFKVLKSIKNCKIRIMDDQKQVGHFCIQVEKLLSSEVQQQFTQDFEYENGVYAGTIKFQTIKGKMPSFSQPRQTIKQRKSLLQKQYLTKAKDDSYFAQHKAFTSLPPNPYANIN